MESHQSFVPADAIYVRGDILLFVIEFFTAGVVFFFAALLSPYTLLPKIVRPIWILVLFSVSLILVILFFDVFRTIHYSHEGFTINTVVGRRFLNYQDLKNVVAAKIGWNQVLVQLSLRGSENILSLLFTKRGMGHYYQLVGMLTKKGIYVEPGYLSLTGNGVMAVR